MTRSKKYLNDEDRRDAIRKSKSKYMLKASWFCSICNEFNGNHNYHLAGKFSHLKTKRHKMNYEKNISNLKINIII